MIGKKNCRKDDKMKTIFNLDLGDEYFSINMNGDIVKNMWIDDEYDHKRLRWGNVYLTEELAIAFRENEVSKIDDLAKFLIRKEN